MVVMGQLKSTERVAHFISELSALYGERGVATRPLTLHIARAEIAGYLGLTIETVSRSFEPRVLPNGQSMEVWIFDDDTPLRRIGSLRSALIHDARHHGQDLLDELVGCTLKQIERRPARAGRSIRSS
jgi:hypothetical protein